MSRRVIVSVLGAASLLAASVAGASSASALVTGATAPTQDFGDVAVYSAQQKTVTITASGSAVTFGTVPTIEAIGSAQDQADDYRVVSDTCTGTTVPQNSTCTVVVEFRPFAAGTRAANLSVPTTSPAETVLVGLTGVGIPNATGTYYGLATPTRFLDTRTSGTKAPLAAGATTSVQITGVAGIPSSGVSAVVINLTAVQTTSAGYFTVYPSDRTRPTASSINFPAGWTGANMVTVPVGAVDGKLRLYNYGGKAHAIVDVLGWYAKNDTVRAAKGMGAQFLATDSGDPERIYDSRQDLPFYSGDYIEFKDTWTTPEAAAAVKAYAMNITAVGATSSGVLTSWAGGAVTKPKASTVNYQKGVVAPNMAVVPAGHNSTTATDDYGPNDTGFRIENTGGGQVDIVVDITGYYVADDRSGMRFKPLAGSAPKRILDTRNGTGLTGAFGAKQARNAPATSVATSDSIYVVGNTTGVKPTVGTYLTIWSGETSRPTSSNLNVNAGLVRAVSTYAPLSYNSSTGALTYGIYNNAGSMHVLFDAAGTLDLYPTQAMLATSGATAQGAAAPTADRTLAGRKIPGADSFTAGLDRSTHRRG
jgi:hypothetical protein